MGHFLFTVVVVVVDIACFGLKNGEMALLSVNTEKFEGRVRRKVKMNEKVYCD